MNKIYLYSFWIKPQERKEREEENDIRMGRKTKGITEFRKPLFLLQRKVLRKRDDLSPIFCCNEKW